MVLRVALVDADEIVVRGVAAMLQAHGDHCQLVDLSSSGADVVLYDTVAVGQDEGLTAREAEVLSLIAGGLSNTDVAARMGLSINSVKSYVRSSYRKIGVESRSQAVLWGLTHGLGPGSGTEAPAEAEDGTGQDRLA